MKKLLMVTTALMMSAPAFAADGFGDRFGSDAPQALSDGMDNTIANTQGFGMDGFKDPAALNQIDPAAGEEDAQAHEAELEAETEAEANIDEDVAPTANEPEEVPTEVETATETETQPETGSAAVEPAAGVDSDVDATIIETDTKAGASANIDASTDPDVIVEE